MARHSFIQMSKTFQSICNHFAQGTYILVLRRKNAHLIRICLTFRYRRFYR